MKHYLFALALICFGSTAHANPYFRLINPSHPQVGAGFLISPKSPLDTTAITDIALVTHSIADGTIIPESWRSVFPPVAWTPLQLGFGGSLKGDAIIAPGTSANIAPAVASILMGRVDGSSSGAAQAIKAALAGSGPGQIRLGGALACTLTKAGVFQAAKDACPGRGPLEIIGNAARVDAGYAWRF